MKKFKHFRFNCDNFLSEILIAELSDLGFDSFSEDNQGFEASIESTLYDHNAFDALLSAYKNQFHFECKMTIVKDRNWNEEWEKSFNPITVDGKCLVRATFHKPDPRIQFEVIIDPKMSFGTGHHDTTYLMISNILKQDFSNKTILDAGCGTGILSILAEKKSAKSIFAYDIDTWAYENTLENIRLNSCEKITVSQGDNSVIPIATSFDFVLANINRNVILQDFGQLTKCLEMEGYLMLSGFFVEDQHVLVNEALAHKMELIMAKSRNQWLSLVFKRFSL